MGYIKMLYYEWIEKLQNTQGTNNKIAVLKEAIESCDTFKTYIQKCYDPYFNTWTKKFDIPKNPAATIGKGSAFSLLLDAINSFNSRSNDNIEKVFFILNNSNVEELPHLVNFLKKDIRAGISISSINKACPNLIHEFEVALAQPFNDKKINYPFMGESKFDGGRIIAIVKDKNVTYYSRNGKIKELDNRFDEELLALSFNNDVVFDGELMGEDFQQTMTQMNRKHDKNTKQLIYHIFDLVSYNDWISENRTMKFFDRKILLWQAFSSLIMVKPLETIKYVGYRWINNEAEMMEFYKEQLTLGFEGIMIKDPEAPYKFGRSYNIIKLKPETTEDLVVIDVEEGEGKYKGMMGALVVDYKGVKVNVGSGYSDELREYFWNDKENLIGKIVEVKFQEVTPDGSLRFPVYVRTREDKL